MPIQLDSAESPDWQPGRSILFPTFSGPEQNGRPKPRIYEYHSKIFISFHENGGYHHMLSAVQERKRLPSDQICHDRKRKRRFQGSFLHDCWVASVKKLNNFSPPENRTHYTLTGVAPFLLATIILLHLKEGRKEKGQGDKCTDRRYKKVGSLEEPDPFVSDGLVFPVPNGGFAELFFRNLQF